MFNQILADAFVNIMILTSFVSLANRIFRNFPISETSTLRYKALFSLINLLLSLSLMWFPLHISTNMSIDLKLLPIIVVALYIGIIPSFIVGAVVIGIKILFVGINSWTIPTSVTILLIAIGVGAVSKLKIRFIKKCVYAFAYIALVNFCAIFTTIKNSNQAARYGLYFALGMVVSGLFIYYVSMDIRRYNASINLLKDASNKDYLTGLYNIRYFNILLSQYGKKLKAQKEIFSIIMVDTDNFKCINDKYGHLAGNKIIKELGLVLSDACRKMDIVVRIGGDEFTILLPDCNSKEAFEVAERIRRTVEKHKFVLSDGTYINVTISVGCMTYCDEKIDVDKIIQEVDNALYKAKKCGKNMVCSV